MECEKIERTFPSSFRLIPHNVSGIPATSWLTMWTECEEFVSLNEDPYCETARSVHKQAPIQFNEKQKKKQLEEAIITQLPVLNVSSNLRKDLTKKQVQ